jgi:Spy/CpxP family protein refolding chaperone
MKKLLLVFAVVAALYTTDAAAQGGGDPAARAQQMKERMKPMLVEKVKLTDEQADKVLDINMEVRQKMREFRDLSPEDRKTKAAELDADRDKKYKAIPLTDDQVKAVNEFFDEMRKQQQQRQGGQR